MTEQPRKLIEVALPLDEINAACKADKDRKTGTIRNLHKWFAPMPLPRGEHSSTPPSSTTLTTTRSAPTTST